MDEEYVKELLARAEEKKLTREKKGKKVPLSLSISAPVLERFKTVLNGADHNEIIENLIEHFISLANKEKKTRNG